MEHTPCSSDLAHNDFWLFPKIVSLKGKKISGYWKTKWLLHRKHFHNRSSRMFPTVAASLS
jgi:hypothetical protein